MMLAAAPLLNRPGRSVLTVLGTVLGVGMLVVTVGLTSSASAQINERFDSLDATEVQAVAAPDTVRRTVDDASASRALTLRGVVGAGLIRTQVNPEPTVSPDPGPAAMMIARRDGGSPSVMAASVGALEVMQVHVSQGHAFTTTEEAARARVALIGVAAAGVLGISRVPADIYLDGVRFLAQGIIGRAPGDEDALVDVVLPEGTAETVWRGGQVASDESLIVRTRLGYAAPVARALAATIDPFEPGNVSVSSPPSPVALGAAVSGDLTALLIVLAGLGLIVGVVGIANTTLVSVLERVPEIGLRRAIGARKRQIAMQFISESLTLGTLGGALGAMLGTIAISVVALANAWTPVLSPWVIALAPCAGAATGALAGAYPAFRAASIDPVLALGR